MTRVVALLCAIAAVASIGASSPSPVSTTRFRVDPSGRILLPVAVDGAPHTFVFDTADRFTIGAALIPGLHHSVNADRHGARTVDDVSLELLGVTLPHQALRVSPADMADDGIVGAELCDRFIVKVDFRASRITLWERSVEIDTRRASIVPADFSGGAPTITVGVRANGVAASPASLVVGLTLAPGRVSFAYQHAAESGLLDAAPNGELPIELRDVTKTPVAAVAQLPREPERPARSRADGVVSARTLTRSWIVFDAAHSRVVVGS